MPHSVISASCLANPCVINRVVSVAYRICTRPDSSFEFPSPGPHRKEQGTHMPIDHGTHNRPLANAMTGASKHLSRFTNSSVINRVVSIPYSICTPRDSFFEFCVTPTPTHHPLYWLSMLRHIRAIALATLAAAALAAQSGAPNHVPPKRSSQIQNGFGINSDLPRDPYLPWDRHWWTRMFDAGVSWIRIGQYENTSDYTSWDWIEQK